jgi:hypothetical protein
VFQNFVGNFSVFFSVSSSISSRLRRYKYPGMNTLRYIASFLFVLTMVAVGSAQSRAYAKFDGKGKIIGLFNLADVESCRYVRTVVGTVRNVRSELRQDSFTFSFTLVSTDRSWLVDFSMKADAMARSDVEALLTDKRHRRVNVRACRSGSRWLANDITRQ